MHTSRATPCCPVASIAHPLLRGRPASFVKKSFQPWLNFLSVTYDVLSCMNIAFLLYQFKVAMLVFKVNLFHGSQKRGLGNAPEPYYTVRNSKNTFGINL